MKLEVGMYVRTKHNGIKKIASLYVEAIFTDNHIRIENKDILKTSHNIIDLIEEHDYIRIITSAYFEPVYYSYGKLVIRDDIDISKYTNKFIAEVITYEQIEQMAYKVGE